MRTQRVAIVGAGIGGLVAAVELAHRGLDVTLIEQAEAPGGKLRPALVGGARIDAGPTVFTLRHVFEEIFADIGEDLAAHLTLRPLECLARHAWSADERLDLFADAERSAEAIGDFAGSAAAAGYRRFCIRARQVFKSLEQPFIRAARPSLAGLIGAAGMRGLPGLARISPFTTLWRALGTYFPDPRLRQLFARYATYCGASPFLAPATLMLIAHVEQAGVWSVDGGMHRIASVLADLATRRGATLRYGVAVAEILLAGGRAAGVRLADGARIAADAVVLNADTAALAGGLFGAGPAAGVARRAPARSLSAITWAMRARPEGFPLLRHNVFFSTDYAAEFDDVFARSRPPLAPSVYLCAEDREGDEAAGEGDAERLFCLINAPATGDHHPFDSAEIAACERRTWALLARCGLRLEVQNREIATPAIFAQRYPATGGALYGPAGHGWQASFRRAACRSRLAGLYLAGGSVHPGPGVPMAALSGRMAAAALLADGVSMTPCRPVAMPGGISMRSATTAPTRSP